MQKGSVIFRLNDRIAHCGIPTIANSLVASKYRTT